MKKKQKINKALRAGEWFLLGLTAAFLCVLFLLTRRPALTARPRLTPPDAPAEKGPAAPGGASGETGGADGEAGPVADGGASGEAGPGADGEASGEAGPGADGRVNLNTADADALCSLPGVGPALAGRILACREARGPFARPEDLTRVSGIGEAKYAALADLVTV